MPSEKLGKGKMAKFIVPYNGEIRIEAASAEEARTKAYGWRKFVMQCVHGHLEELNIERVSMKSMLEVTEVSDAWLENQRLRSKFRAEWEHSNHLVPVMAGSKLCFTHRIAIRPVPKPESASEVQLEGNTRNPGSVLQEDYDKPLD